MTAANSDPCEVSAAALASAREEKLDWRFKAVPSALHGLSVDEAAARRPGMFTGGFLGPMVVLEADALEHNLRTMADWCARRGLALAPHGKTTMAPQLFAKQAAHGAWAITAANVGQLRVYRAFEVSRVLLANQLVDSAGLRWLAGELDADADFEFCCWVDSVSGVRLMTDALRDCGARRPVDVLVELGADGGRTGARDEATAHAVARAVVESPRLRLAGVGGYEGALAHDASEPSRAIVADYLRRLRELTESLAHQGLFADVERIIVTAGGSAYFDQIAEGIVGGWPEGLPVLPVLRSGGYLTHDDGFYREISPLGEHPRITDAAPLRSALRAWAQVSSKPSDELALLTIGKRDASFDEGLPEPQVRRDQETVHGLPGHRVTKMNDQHAFLELPPDSPVQVGDWIGLGLSHPCTVFDKWSLIPVVDGEVVVDFIRTYF